ncbi:6-phosphogluconolactonase [Patulibacter minatonensis]|uniref:6-phosphogluconolactonase n=1 Tax=Patulibacter minatonensis TaxID=298163 RepID=UPI0004BCCA74|nr:6-phosphogluconolactonase [Patulibacter minatonensis]
MADAAPRPTDLTAQNGFRVVPVADAEAAKDVTARALSDAITAVRAEAAARVRLALSGGGTPVGAYERLATLIDDWPSVDVFLADERCVPYGDDDSNARLIDEALGTDRGHVLHRLDENGSPGDRARAYANELGAAPLDVVLLGLGEDGHTASLEPGHPSLEADGVTVAVLDMKKPPPERVSLTVPALRAAGRILLLVTGEGKAEALSRTLRTVGPDAPASLLRPETLTVIADEAALAEARSDGAFTD